jgi:hypothetical protein
VKFGHLKLEPTRPTSNSPTTAPSPRQLS